MKENIKMASTLQTNTCGGGGDTCFEKGTKKTHKKAREDLGAPGPDYLPWQKKKTRKEEAKN